jgi:hypothetical protein
MRDFREHARNHLRTAAGTYIWAVPIARHKGRKPDLRCALHRGLVCGQTRHSPHATTRKMYETAARLYEQKGQRTKPTPLSALRVKCCSSISVQKPPFLERSRRSGVRTKAAFRQSSLSVRLPERTPRSGQSPI